MGKHTGRIHILAEFPTLPYDRGSLGDMEKIKSTGVCKHIRLRLRKYQFPAIFLSIDAVVQTLVHELAHMKDSSHGLELFRWNAELLKELEEAVEKGGVRRDEVPVRATNYRETKLLEALEALEIVEGDTADVSSLEEQMATCTISE